MGDPKVRIPQFFFTSYQINQHIPNTYGLYDKDILNRMNAVTPKKRRGMVLTADIQPAACHSGEYNKRDRFLRDGFTTAGMRKGRKESIFTYPETSGGCLRYPEKGNMEAGIYQKETM